ncbi:Ltp family lipoprotein [Enterococcus sp.]|nr:Ltp family lipoprotein [Enterococcus sp.]
MDIDWKAQAHAKALDYLDYSSFSDSGLYDQLIYEQFTADEAQYAIDNLD